LENGFVGACDRRAAMPTMRKTGNPRIVLSIVGHTGERSGAAGNPLDPQECRNME
jgi:hypothetical protein